MSDEYDVSIEGVTKRFGDVTAVDDVSLRIERGKFLTLLGPSGCGKTTTLRCIAGFETPTEGDVYIRGERVNDVPAFERDTSMVFQSYALFPHMTVGENVAFGLEMGGLPENRMTDGGTGAESTTDGATPAGDATDANAQTSPGTDTGTESQSRRGVRAALARLLGRRGSEAVDARVSSMLSLVELPGTEDRAVSELSGGQQQRVALARALVTEPTVLLLDEPLGALDLKLRKNMQVELKNLQEELGITFVYVTHDQEEALTMSDEIAVMNGGRVEQVGDATAIYERPESEFVADFIGETNLVRGTYRETDAGAVVERGDLAFAVPKTSDASGEVAFAIRPEKIRLDSDASDLDNEFEGDVIEEIYKGNLGKFVVRLDDGTELTVDMQLRDRDQYDATGGQVTIGWAPDNCVVLTR